MAYAEWDALPEREQLDLLAEDYDQQRRIDDMLDTIAGKGMDTAGFVLLYLAKMGKL